MLEESTAAKQDGPFARQRALFFCHRLSGRLRTFTSVAADFAHRLDRLEK